MSEKPLTVNDVIMSSPPEPCAHCGKQFPSATLMPINDYRPERVCVGCGFKAMHDGPFSRLMNLVRKKYYVRDWGRPCGVEPKVFTSPEDAEAGDGCYCEASVVEFDTEAAALAFIKTQQSGEDTNE